MGDKSQVPNKTKIPVSIGGFNVASKKPPQQIPSHKPKEPTIGDLVPPPIDDPQIDKVIDDIVMSESNEVLAAEDAIYMASLEQRTKKKPKRFTFKKIIKSKWTYIILVLLIAGLMAYPLTRYKILSLFVKSNYQVTVEDSVTNQPVSYATISIDKKLITTNANGQASTALPLGKYNYIVKKAHYSTFAGNVFVGLTKPKVPRVIKLIATGRQVTILVTNKLSGRPLAGVTVNILNANYQTNNQGQTQLILPTQQQSYEASFSATGFNSVTVPVSIISGGKPQQVKLVPSGYIYYLNSDSGTIDVIKANLDGTNPTIELAGTGKENSATTALIPSPDWKYLVLEAQRNTAHPVLYVINTTTGNLTEFDSSQDSYLLIGWSGDNFIYDEVSTSTDTSTVGREQIKSYNAQTGQLNVLDQDQTSGTDPSYAFQSFTNFELLANELVYTTIWNSVASYDVSSLNDTIRSVQSNGLNKKDYTQFSAATTGKMSVVRYQPQSLYISVDNTTSNQTSYYTYSDGAVSTSNITSQIFSQSSPNFFISPSNLESLWTTSTNNQDVTYIGNQSGQSPKNLNLQNNFAAYGWYDRSIYPGK